MASPKKSPQNGRDWITTGLVLAILYLALLLPFTALIGARPEIVGGVIGALTTALVGIVTVRAAKK